MYNDKILYCILILHTTEKGPVSEETELFFFYVHLLPAGASSPISYSTGRSLSCMVWLSGLTAWRSSQGSADGTLLLWKQQCYFEEISVN